MSENSVFLSMISSLVIAFSSSNAAADPNPSLCDAIAETAKAVLMTRIAGHSAEEVQNIIGDTPGTKGMVERAFALKLPDESIRQASFVIAFSNREAAECRRPKLNAADEQKCLVVAAKAEADARTDGQPNPQKAAQSALNVCRVQAFKHSD